MELRRTFPFALLLGGCLSWAAATIVSAAPVYWDASPSAGIQGGAGDWNTSSFWNSASNGAGSFANWTNGADAYFTAADAPSTITIPTGPFDVGALVHTGNQAVTLNSGGTLRAATAGGNLTLNSSASALLTIDSVIANNTSASTLTKTGSGTVVLGASNTFSGNIVVNGGMLRGSTSTGAFGAGGNTRTITVNNGGTLNFNRVGMYGNHNTVTTPALILNAGGVATNTHQNNGLYNVTLNGGTLTSTAANSFQWGSWNINGTVTSTGNSLITRGITQATTVMLQSVTGTPNTNFNVPSGTLTIATGMQNGRAGGGNPSVATSLTKLGDGTLTLTTPNFYTGGTVINDGTLLVNNPVTAAINKTTAGLSIGNNTDTLLTVGSTNDLTVGMAVAGYSNILIHTIVDATRVRIGNLSGAGATLPAGTTTFITGSATGTGAVTVNSGGTLGGTGALTGAVTVNAGGRLAPGASTESLAIGSLTLNSGAFLDIEIGGTNAGAALNGYDQLQVTGNVNLGDADLNLLRFLNFVPTSGDTFFILTNDLADAVNGIFNGLADDSNFLAAGWMWNIRYNVDDQTQDFSRFSGNDIAVQALFAVPEPSTLALGAALFALGAVRLRRNRRDV